MKKIIFIACSLFLSLADSQTMAPGLWKTTASFKLNGIQLPSTDSETCVSAEEAKNTKETISKGLKKDGCQLTKWNLKDNKLEAGVSCKNKDIEAEGTLHGKVTAKNYVLVGDAEGTFMKALPSVATLKLTGTWVKSCKK